jgi:hypothetical protein
MKGVNVVCGRDVLCYVDTAFLIGNDARRGDSGNPNPPYLVTGHTART